MDRRFVIAALTAAFVSLVAANGTPDQESRLLRVESALEVVLQQNEALLKKVEFLERRVEHLEEENKLFREVAENDRKQPEPESQRTNSDDGEHPAKDGEVKMSPIKQHGQSRIKTIGKTANRQGLKKRFLADFQGPTVAFTAVVSPPDLTHIGAGQAIIYDQVITNVGHAYSNHSGIFTAPVSGVYAFNFAVMVNAGEREYVELIKDGTHVMWNYGHGSSAPHYISASRTATLELVQGSEVWVRTQAASSHGTGNIHGNGFTTFSGWLVAITE